MCTHNLTCAHRRAQVRAQGPCRGHAPTVSWPGPAVSWPGLPIVSQRRWPCRGPVLHAGTIVSWLGSRHNDPISSSLLVTIQQVYCDTKFQLPDFLMSRYSKLYRDLHSLPDCTPIMTPLSRYNNCIMTLSLLPPTCTPIKPCHDTIFNCIVT